MSKSLADYAKSASLAEVLEELKKLEEKASETSAKVEELSKRVEELSKKVDELLSLAKPTPASKLKPRKLVLWIKKEKVRDPQGFAKALEKKWGEPVACGVRGSWLAFARKKDVEEVAKALNERRALPSDVGEYAELVDAGLLKFDATKKEWYVAK